jgi:hypothetical protein
MDDVQGPEKVNDNCVKTIYEGTMDRGFTVHTGMLYFRVTILYKISSVRNKHSF